MDAYEATRMVFARVQAIEPDHVSKIMGYLLLQDQGDQEMFCLAFSHDALLQAMVSKVKKDLGLSSSSPSRTSAISSQQQFSSAFPLSYHLSSPTSQLSRSAPASSEYLNPLYYGSYAPDDRIPPSPDHSLHGHENHSSLGLARFASPDRLPVHDRLSEQLLRHDLQLSDQLSFLNDNQQSSTTSHELLHPDMLAILNGKLTVDDLHSRSLGRHFSTSDVLLSPDSITSAAWRPCLYYARGYCKHGSSCRFLHSQVRPDSSLLTSPNNGQQDSGSDDGLMPGSLERLEMELQELLRGRKAPLSIASLPQLYYERFGKTLQAEGYLTESQRHGKAGYSLTKLLARLKNSVTLIDRPHGQHAVVLAEDAYKFTAYRGDKDDLGGVNPGSRQIYLTFPAESAFTEDDVSAHFRVYGPVQDVRIPYQQKRMFGFVTFIYPETVKMILAKGNPHFICGARVLVKPYKEKGKHGDRKFSDREYPRLVTGQGLDSRDYDFISGPRFFLEHDLLRRQLEEQELIIELERRRLAELQIEKQRRQSPSVPSATTVSAVSQAPQVIPANGFFSEDPARPTEDLQPIQTSSAFEFLVDTLDSDGQGDKLEAQEKVSKDIRSDEHNLPDSPFTSPHKSFAPPDIIDGLTLEGQSESSGLLVSSASFDIVKELNCRICMDFFVDPMELDCGHVFCVQCILKVIRVSKDECPICQRHIGSQIVKLLESRRLQVIDPNLTKGAQTIW